MAETSYRLGFKVALAFLASLALGGFFVHLDERNHVLQAQKGAMDIAALHGHLLQERVDRSLSATYALAAVLRQGGGQIDNFDELAGEMIRLYGGLSSLQLAPKGVIAQIVPLAGNEAAMGHDLLKDPKRNKEAFAAVETKKLTLAGPFTLRQGGVAVIGRLPVFLPGASGREEFWGFTTALIRIGELLEASKLDSLAPAGYRYELSRIHPDTGLRDVFAGSGQVHDPVSFVVQVPNGQWTLSVVPEEGWQPSTQTRLIELAMLLLIAILVALLTHHVLKQPLVLGREVALRTRDLRESNRKLEAEIVERRHAEDALRESEGRFRNMADTVPVLIWMLDPAMQASYFNRAWLNFTGRALEQELGEGWVAGLREDEVDSVLQAVRQDFAEHRSFHGEFRLRRHDGEYRWLANHGIARFTPDGEFAGYIGASLDVTDLKNAERVLRTARDELEKRVAERTAELTAVNAALHEEQARQETLIKRLGEAQNQLLQSEKMASIGQLAAGVAHEINNPIGFINSNLNTLQGYIDDLLAVVAVYEEAADPLLTSAPESRAKVAAIKEKAELAYLREDLPTLLKETQEGVVRVRKIVQDLKEFSHVDSVEWQVTDLHRGLDSTLNMVWNELKYKAEVVKDYGEIPPVECLGSQLNQVFMNLLVNAAQAIDQRGVITIRTVPDGEGVRIDIADTGKGIPAENLNRIFEPFFTTKPVGKGTGLGLSLSYSIARKHGGRIEVQSEVGKGSVFSVWLPLQRPAVPGEDAPAAAVAASGT